eukprot:TRINITY_DN17585_c0_g2_i1.p1 TRINITY_DN17585_c0_g2~~TRINITY_DN17585_c0_g2_i1.p1  ORF type:complete len:349 (+),score=39.31 TRINITY_DN17585_c0_g2_i1:73-1119(+)
MHVVVYLSACTVLIVVLVAYLRRSIRSHAPEGQLGRPLVFYSPSFSSHLTPSSHPESPLRTTLAEAVLREKLGSRLHFERIDELHDDIAASLSRVHDFHYLSDLAKEIVQLRALDADTFASPASWNTVRLATSAWLAAVDRVLDTPRFPALALTRPPGHHATRNRSQGFCLVNHGAAAALYALERKGILRVAVLDIDAHFGNGVADILSVEPRTRYCSLHQFASYPFSGEEGTEPSRNMKYLEIDPGASGAAFLSRLNAEALPWLLEMKPQLLLVLAGFDALHADPLVHLKLEPSDYATIARSIRQAFTDVPIVIGLEGGYSLNETFGMPDALVAMMKEFASALPVEL